MRTTGNRRRGIITGCLATVAIAPIVIAAGTVTAPSAMAQQPGPVQPGWEPRTPIELLETAHYLLQTGRERQARPYLDRFEKSRPIDLWAAADAWMSTGRSARAVPYLSQFFKNRPDDATLIAIRNQFGARSILRLNETAATRPFAQPMIVALAAAEQRTKAQSSAPGPELFARDPRTPIELWDAVDYLVRTDQAPKAVPYLDRFQKAQPDDATLVAVRDRFGAGSFMRLYDDPATRPFAQPLSDALAAAARRYATRPDRVARFIADLTQTPAEQDYALRRLREAGPYAVPPLIEALRRPDLSREDHELLVRNIGRLESSAVPPLAAALESPDPAAAADAATALASIGDPAAVPFLTFTAAAPAARSIGARRRAGRDRAADRPAVRAAAEAARPPAGRRGLVVSPRASRAFR